MLCRPLRDVLEGDAVSLECVDVWAEDQKLVERDPAMRQRHPQEGFYRPLLIFSPDNANQVTPIGRLTEFPRSGFGRLFCKGSGPPSKRRDRFVRLIGRPS